MEKVNFELSGIVSRISRLEQIRRTVKPDLYKKMITIETIDGQTLFVEIRNNNLKTLEREGVEEGSLVKIAYTFQGTEKGDKVYNNIVLSSITRV